MLLTPHSSGRGSSTSSRRDSRLDRVFAISRGTCQVLCQATLTRSSPPISLPRVRCQALSTIRPVLLVSRGREVLFGVESPTVRHAHERPRGVSRSSRSTATPKDASSGRHRQHHPRTGEICCLGAAHDLTPGLWLDLAGPEVAVIARIAVTRA